jgi:hypothetical protein
MKKNNNSNDNTLNNVISLDVVRVPATIPPAPASGVFVTAPKTAKDSTAPSTALPCATYWAGGAVGEALRPSQVRSVAADEIDWLFEHMEDEADPAVVHARAAIESWMSELSDAHQAAVAAQHCPLAWPEELPGHEDDSFALVLWLLCPSDRLSLRTNRPEQLEYRARRRLEITLERKGARALRTLIRQARWLYEEAVHAYAAVRGTAPSVLPLGSTGFASSWGESLDESALEGAA